MPSSPENVQWPRVSFIMPTLNAGALLDNVLASITRQTYPRDRYEIILADAHSKDRTREIARKYGAVVLDDNGKNMEEGKRLALQHATGDYVVFVDADNEITHADYVELAVNALAANPRLPTTLSAKPISISPTAASRRQSASCKARWRRSRTAMMRG